MRTAARILLRIRTVWSSVSLVICRINVYCRIYRKWDKIVPFTRMRRLVHVCIYHQSTFVPSRKHAYIILTPLKPHFYIGFKRVYIIFLISAQNIDCGYSLEPPRRGGSNENPQSMFWAEIWKISEFLLSGNFQFLVIKFSIYLNRRVFVMPVAYKTVSLVSMQHLSTLPI